MTKAEVGKRYRHYKGEEYTVLAVGRHTETDEEFVVYRQEYIDDNNNPIGTVWIRPKKMWEGQVELRGKEEERFSKIN